MSVHISSDEAVMNVDQRTVRFVIAAVDHLKPTKATAGAIGERIARLAQTAHKIMDELDALEPEDREVVNVMLADERGGEAARTVSLDRKTLRVVAIDGERV